MDDFDELRRLLLGREQEELRALREQLADRERQTREVSRTLPNAIRLSRESGDELNRALAPTVEKSIQETIEKRPQSFIDVFFPIIGPLVRRSIAEALRGLLQSLNQTLEHTFSWQGLKWRWEAWRTGRSFAEVVMLRSLVYRVEQVFLFHRETSMSLLHVTADAGAGKDSDMIAGMLSAIQDFARDAFEVGEDEALEETRIGALNVWLALGRHAFLAAVIRGNPPRSYRTVLEEAVDFVHLRQGANLANFQGDPAVFEPLRPELEACLQSQFRREEGAPKRPAKAWLALAGAAALLAVGATFAVRHELRWRDFTRQLQAEPGLALTDVRHHWISDSRVAGLRDATAADPAALARAAGVDPGKVQFAWKEYLALDPVTMQRRFTSRFGLPPDTKITLEAGALELAGTAPYEWLERVRREAQLLPGIDALHERDLKITYDPALALARFTSAYPLPSEVRAELDAGTLALSGSAPYEWMVPVREGATRLPGITAISEEKLRVAFDPKRVLRRFQELFGLPDSVNATFENGTLALSGEASHGWLSRVQSGAQEVAGITTLDDKNLTDLDLRAFTQSKSIIESAFIYFLTNKDKFATEGFAALSRLPDEIRVCRQAGERIGLGAQFMVDGYADGVGDVQKNHDLSQRRADAVRDFLISCGLKADLFQAEGLGEPPEPTPGEKRLPEEADRRVAFRVMTTPLSTRP